MVPGRTSGDHGQREPVVAPDVVAERPAVLSENYQQQEQQTGRRHLLLQRDEPADWRQRRQPQRHATDCR